MVGRHKNRNARSQELARKRIIAQRGNNCEKCFYPGYVELHHIQPVEQGGSFDDSNLILLCEKCHAEAHGIKKKKYLDKNREKWLPWVDLSPEEQKAYWDKEALNYGP